MSTDIQIGGTVNQPLRDLELRREELFRQIENLGDFRRGIISVNYRKCGKSNCACARKGHPGHGPQYLWNVSVGGKTQARNLPLGPELGQVQQDRERLGHLDLEASEMAIRTAMHQMGGVLLEKLLNSYGGY